ncbi:hypothetical protein AAFF_G00150860 [Aldrovandia affinis]|uniref:Uncharacterized protein n=1 Tax=Aldrovandia affinis TaxID=143900 RepID=A0AAD7RPB7_9TELE|nr:hypothetical protein AAFF_G00150860 [Aldrovandia affinis]
MVGFKRLEVEAVVEASCSGGRGVIGLSPEPQEEGPGLGLGAGPGAGPGCRTESSEPQTLYRDIWTLRASLEQCVSSDQSSNNDRDSDGGDEPEGDGGAEGGAKAGKQDGAESERGAGGDGDSGNRKLLQMDSGYASIEAPCRGPEELRVLGSSAAGARDKTASEKRRYFTSAGRKGTVGESLEARLFEELEDEAGGGGSQETHGPVGWSPYGQMFVPREAAAHPHPHLHRRDYSIDEKTDALFHEFLRHDPQFDQQESPLRPKHRSRVHLRKQWQRSSSTATPACASPRPGAPAHPPTPRRQRQLPAGRLLPRAPAEHRRRPREEPGAPPTRTPPEREQEEEREEEQEEEDRGLSPARTIKEEEDRASGSSPPPASSSDGAPEPPEDGRQAGPPHEPVADERAPPPRSLPPLGGPQTVTAELMDKLAASVEERLYSGLRRPKDSPECAVSVCHASPDHSPV